MSDSERFTDRAHKVLALANQEAQRLNHEYIGTEHILLGLVKEGTGVGANTLKNFNIDLRKVRLEVEKFTKSGPDMVTFSKLPRNAQAKLAIEYAIEESSSFNHNYVGTEHILLGLIREHDGVAGKVLISLGLSLKKVREEVLDLLSVGAEKSEQISPIPLTIEERRKALDEKIRVHHQEVLQAYQRHDEEAKQIQRDCSHPEEKHGLMLINDLGSMSNVCTLCRKRFD